MPHALVIGGTGLVGRVVARRLLADGWAVSVPGRDATHLPADVAAAGARFVPADRDDDAAALAAAAGRRILDAADPDAPGGPVIARAEGDARLPRGRDEEFFTDHFGYAAEDEYLAWCC